MQGEYNYPANITPSYQSQKKLEPLKDVSLVFCLLIMNLYYRYICKLICKLNPKISWDELNFKIFHTEKLQTTYRQTEIQPGYGHPWNSAGQNQCPTTQQRKHKLSFLLSVFSLTCREFLYNKNIFLYKKIKFLTIQLNYKANYEKTKSQYTLSQDTPELKKAKANAELVSDVSLYCTNCTNTKTLTHCLLSIYSM